MNSPNPGYFYIAITISFTVLGQLLVKAGMTKATSLVLSHPDLGSLIVAGFLQVQVLAGLACALLAAVAWFPAISRLPISVAYPFMALPIVLVLFLAPICFGEKVAPNQWFGVLLVSFGLWVAAR